jgi:hypothetical protein
MKTFLLFCILVPSVLLAQSQTISFTSSDVEDTYHSITKYDGILTFSANSYLGYDAVGGGLYGYLGPNNETEINIRLNGLYCFYLLSLKARAENDSLTFYLTYEDNTTEQFTLTGISSSSLQKVSDIRFPIYHLTKVSVYSSQYAIIQDVEVYESFFIPVELTDFAVTAKTSNATLAWKTATETNNYGFDIERRIVEAVSSKSQTTNINWEKVGFVAGNGTSNSAHSYSYSDASVISGTYAYRLKQIDNDGIYKYSSEAEVTISAPKVFALNQNYPNPFNPTTTIKYDIPVGTHGNVSIKVFDIVGHEVASLVNETKEAGSYQAVWNAGKFASGVYFYRLQAGSFTRTKKLILMK